MERLAFPTPLLEQEEGDESLLSCSMGSERLARGMVFAAISFPGGSLKPAGDAMSEPGMSPAECSRAALLKWGAQWDKVALQDTNKPWVPALPEVSPGDFGYVTESSSGLRHQLHRGLLFSEGH